MSAQGNSSLPSLAQQMQALPERLVALASEQQALEQELRTLEDRAKQASLSFRDSRVAGPALSPKEKIALFLSLFAARPSVYPKLWENSKTGRRGYSPACDNEWRPGICRKPQIKCTDCPHQRFPALDETAVEAHLRGAHSIGTYAIREDDSCIFVAADFDGDGWPDDVRAFRDAGRRAGVAIAVERSRSGAGAHAWIFFSGPIPAVFARRLATLLLAMATGNRPTMRLQAYIACSRIRIPCPLAVSEI